MHRTISFAMTVLLAMAGVVRADEPRPIPLTRPEMKQLLEEMKKRTPRIPLPPLTDEEKAALGERVNDVSRLYEGRLRSVYLPAGDGFGFGGGNRSNAAAGATGGNSSVGSTNANAKGANNGAPNFARNADPNMSLDYAFKTELFWIVSRTNNCQYCMGHQESKLLGAGLKEDEIAALDGDWSEFTPAQRAAFAFARKVTFEPYNLNDGDIDKLRNQYKDLQILEMLMSVSGNNAINRWKEGAGIPQYTSGGNFGSRRADGAAQPAERPAATESHSYLTPTAEKNQKTISKVAAVTFDSAGAATSRTVSVRPKLESREETEKALEAAKKRTARLPMVDEAKARAAFSEIWPEGPLPNWVRLAANFPREGTNRVAAVRNHDEKTNLKPLLKAQAAWIIARGDRAWYAAGLAKKKLKELGQTDEQIYKLDGDWSDFSEADRAAFTVARKLASSPVVLTDSDVAEAVKLNGPRDTVQLISFVTTRAWLDRVTEAAGLPIEE